MKVMRKFAPVVALVGGLVLAGAGSAYADATAEGAAIGSPGVLSGNLIQIPVDLNVNACGNSVNVIGLANPAFGNTCTIDSHGSTPVVWHHAAWHHNVLDHEVWVKENKDQNEDCN